MLHHYRSHKKLFNEFLLTRTRQDLSYMADPLFPVNYFSTKYH